MPGLVRTKILASEPQPARTAVNIMNAIIGIPVDKAADNTFSVIEEVMQSGTRIVAQSAQDRHRRPDRTPFARSGPAWLDDEKCRHHSVVAYDRRRLPAYAGKLARALNVLLVHDDVIGAETLGQARGGAFGVVQSDCQRRAGHSLRADDGARARRQRRAVGPPQRSSVLLVR